MVHLYSGVFASFVLIYGLGKVAARYQITLPVWFEMFLLIATNALIALGWEIGEFFFDLTFDTQTQVDNTDTMVDMIGALPHHWSSQGSCMFTGATVHFDISDSWWTQEPAKSNALGAWCAPLSTCKEIRQTDHMSTHEFVIVQTTTDSSDEVQRLAGAAVEQQLAACVQVSEIQSYYRWDGKVEQDQEYLLSLKTTAAAVYKIKALIAQQHSYDEPELVVVPITDGSQGYLQWIRDSVIG